MSCCTEFHALLTVGFSFPGSLPAMGLILQYPLPLNFTAEVIQDAKKEDFSKLLPHLFHLDGPNKFHRFQYELCQLTRE